jgi:uncharacterized protein (DUF169 family)
MRSTIEEALGLHYPPIAIGFLDHVQDDLPRWDGRAMPAGCSFWREAMEGRAFYTVPSDHYNCAVGCHTHGIELPAERANELNETITLMVGNGYLAMSEVPGIPRLTSSPTIVAYGPISDVTFPPDVVLLRVNAAQAMIIYEAALKAGISDAVSNVLGRPSCAILPLTANTGRTAISLGCQGNRMYTGLADGEVYITVPGDRWSDFVEQVREVRRANDAMADYYAARRDALDSPAR